MRERRCFCISMRRPVREKHSRSAQSPHAAARAIKHARGLNHVEVTFESQHQFVDAVITLKPIVEEQGNSFILLLHPVEQMRQLMTSQLGKVRAHL